MCVIFTFNGISLLASYGESSLRLRYGYCFDSRLSLFRLADCARVWFPRVAGDAHCPSLTVLKVTHRGKRHSQSDPRRELSAEVTDH